MNLNGKPHRMSALFEMRMRVGADPRGFSEFATLREELAKLSHPASPDVDWAKVEHLCLRLFQLNGADLHSAVSFALARSQRHGLEGMIHGVSLIEALCAQWSSLWPVMVSVRLDILAWLFSQWQPLLRALPMDPQAPRALWRLDAELLRLAERLAAQGQVTPAGLQALRQQIGGLVQRLDRLPASGGYVPPVNEPLAPGFFQPVVIVPAHPLPQIPASMTPWRKGAIAAGLLVCLAAAGAFAWYLRPPPPPVVLAPVQLDSLSLFEAASVEFTPGSTKALIAALAHIKAQAGWLIEIVGHSDSTGNAQQNLQISYARASAVREWLQRMGDLPNDCFSVRGAADNQPMAGNDTEAGRAANRRVDIRLVPQAQACGQAVSGT